jgi:hypothetical protein
MLSISSAFTALREIAETLYGIPHTLASCRELPLKWYKGIFELAA